MRLAATLAILLPLLPAAAAAQSVTAHGFAMHGALKYPPEAAHLDYVNPAAPKGGAVVLAAIGTYDSLNPYILKGVSAAGLSLTHSSLSFSPADEAFSEYGEVAASIEMPEDRSWVAFRLRPEARFHDGRPMTVEDVIWTFDTLKKDGAPFYRAYYADVVKAEKTGERTVRFSFAVAGNRELPLIVGQMPVLPKHYWEGKDFTRTTLDAPLGSGPYRIAAVDPGRSITFRRDPDWWGKDLWFNRGRYNYETIRFDYYRDPTVSLEAFKAGEYDFRSENSARNWATAYDFPARRDGAVKLEEIPHELPTGLQGYVFNTRRPFFADRKVRQALGYAFDFEWSNKTLFYGSYTRTRSYFSNSDFEAKGLPGPAELVHLEPLRDKVPEEVFTTEYQPPVTDGSGNARDNLRIAARLLREAGWTVKDGRLVNAAGQPMEFEILGSDPNFERISLPFAQNLERLGVRARVRTVDTAQYQNRLDDYDFDMTTTVWGQSLSPGNEQRDFWGSSKASEPGSRNLAGIRDPAVDTLIDLIIQAPSLDQLVARTRALDRVLQWSFYTIPQFHSRSFRLAFWDKFARPPVAPKYGQGFLDTWWIDPARAAAIAPRQGRRG
ncbi:MAG: extracellular solute-binding protein [Thalassobaculales bacterium]